jgi:hypothetical protein
LYRSTFLAATQFWVALKFYFIFFISRKTNKNSKSTFPSHGKHIDNGAWWHKNSFLLFLHLKAENVSNKDVSSMKRVVLFFTSVINDNEKLKYPLFSSQLTFDLAKIREIFC